MQVAACNNRTTHVFLVWMTSAPPGPGAIVVSSRAQWNCLHETPMEAARGTDSMKLPFVAAISAAPQDIRWTQIIFNPYYCST
jgi:hypothetical protein